MKLTSKKLSNVIRVIISPLLILVFSIPSLAETHQLGEKHYKQCSACHLASGAGVPGMFPSLTKRLGPLAESKEGREYLVMVIQAGLMGRLSIEGSTYQGMMPAQGLSLGDDSIASVLNYMLQTFNTETLNKASNVFTAKEVASIKARYPDANGRDVYVLRQAVFAVEK